MALILSRGDSETVVFPDLGITITTLRSRKGKTKLAIDAPGDVKVLRGELQNFDHYYDDGRHGPESD